MRDADCFVDQHYRYILTDRIENFAVFADQRLLQLLLHGLSGAIQDFALRNLIIHPLQERCIGERDLLMRFRATQDTE